MKNLFLLDPSITYLNHGSFGACPISVFNDYQSWQKKLEQQPVEFITKHLWRHLEEARKELGGFLNCHGDDILLFPTITTLLLPLLSRNFLNSFAQIKTLEIVNDRYKFN